MTKCCVLGCKTKNNKHPDYKNRKLGLHVFPKKSDSRYAAYLQATGKEVSELPQNPRICSLHFTESDYTESDMTRILECSKSATTINYTRLTISKLAVPSVHIHYNVSGSVCDTDISCSFSTLSKQDEPPSKLSKLEMCEAVRDAYEVSPSKLCAPRATSTPKKIRHFNQNKKLVPDSGVLTDLDTSDTCNKSLSNTDCTYLQQSEEINSSDGTILSENDTWENADCEYFLVQKSKLKLLFNFCKLCGSPTNNKINYTSGSMVEIETECLNHHTCKWQSQSMVHQKPVGNLALSSAVYLSGLQFAAFDRFTKTLNMKSISKTSHYHNIEHYISPVLRNTWVTHRKQIIEDENCAAAKDKEGTKLIIDGQYDSPGKAAYVHALNTVNVRDGKVIDFAIMKKPPIKAPKGSGDMEKKCCEEVVGRLSEELDCLKIVCTDRSASLKKMFADMFADIEHNFDLWHIDKGFKKKYRAVAIRKWMEKLREWFRHITNHMWYCVANCNKDPEILIKMWKSLLYHVRDIHVWEDDDPDPKKRVCGCFHTDEDFKNTRPAYFDEDDDDFKALKKLVENEQLIKDLQRARQNLHTGAVESFHNLRIMYMPKRVSFSVGGTIDRSILAALDNNNNVGREMVGTRVIYSKKSQRWVWKSMYSEKSPRWRIDLHNAILNIENTPQMEEYEDEFFRLFHFQPIPESSAPIPRPDDDNLPPQFSRFDYIDEDDNGFDEYEEEEDDEEEGEEDEYD